MATIDAVHVEDTASTRNSKTHEGWGIAKDILDNVKNTTISNIEWYQIINHYSFVWHEDYERFFFLTMKIALQSTNRKTM